MIHYRAFSLFSCLAASASLLLACGDDDPARNPPSGDAATFDTAPPILDDGGALPDSAAPPDTGTVTDASSDTGLRDGSTPPPPPPAIGPALYPPDRTLSPITDDVATQLRAIAARAAPDLQEDVFAKVGASSTVSSSFMRCFAGSSVELAGRDALRPTVEHFLAGDAAGTDPYRRESVAATVGWSAWAALEGDPSPLEQEIAAIRPRFALVMYGTNDIQSRDIDRYAENMLDLVDRLVGLGIVPVLYSVMPRDDDAEADLWVPRYNAVVRAVTQARQIPFVDYHRELLPLPRHGLGPDRLHASAYSGGACVFDADGLQHGYNVRNLLSIQTLHTLRTVLLEGGAPPDGDAPRLEGDGTASSPFAIPFVPFVHSADTRESSEDSIDDYPGCSAAQDESGPELVYSLVLDAPTRVRAMLFDRGDVDVDIHLLGASIEGGSCVARDHRVVVADLAAGTHHLVVDTFVNAGGTELGGEYLLVVVPD
ncbi:MAG: SGNH/GDSL hydrolase family protein [Deltaproteobacteria bacterium]|nr:SGNH/GDSL hydrolase family protein [Deltaproteobacteria bacterium]